jgi:hypothetical protein
MRCDRRRPPYGQRALSTRGVWVGNHAPRLVLFPLPTRLLLRRSESPKEAVCRVLRWGQLCRARRWLGVGNTEAVEAGAATATLLLVALSARSSAGRVQAGGRIVDQRGWRPAGEKSPAKPPHLECDGAPSGYQNYRSSAGQGQLSSACYGFATVVEVFQDFCSSR